jgi:uncharacterized membrane protein YbhN (UPF0104 family)
MATMSPATTTLLPPLAGSALRATGAAGLLAGLAWLGLRHIDLGAMGAIDVAWWWFAASLVANLLSVAGKSAAWKAALDALPGERSVTYRQVVPAVFVGFLLNTVLFARIGELARVAVLRRRLRQDGREVAGSTILGTVAVEQLVLGVSLVGFLAVTALFVGAPRSAMLAIAGVTVALVLASAGLVALMRRQGRAAEPPSSRLGRRLERTRGFVDGFARGQALLRRPRLLAQAVLAGVLSWIAQVAGIMWALAAFGVRHTVAVAALVFLSTTIVQLVPILPANVGVFQGAAAVVLTQTYGVDATHAVAFGFGLQLLEMSLGVGLGVIFLWREGLTFGETRRLARFATG